MKIMKIFTAGFRFRGCLALGVLARERVFPRSFLGLWLGPVIWTSSTPCFYRVNRVVRSRVPRLRGFVLQCWV